MIATAVLIFIFLLYVTFHLHLSSDKAENFISNLLLLPCGTEWDPTTGNIKPRTGRKNISDTINSDSYRILPEYHFRRF